MSKDYLPQQVDPFRFAENATRLRGTLSIQNMQRLLTSLYSDEGEVTIVMEFGIDEQKIRFLQGHIEGSVILQCQRCMEKLPYTINNDFCAGLVETDEEAELLPKQYDPVMVTEGSLIIQDMIEDELIINLPIVPMHDMKDCKVKLPLVAEDEIENVVKKDNPFKVIESLRSKRDDK